MGASSYTNQLNLARVSTSYAPETIRKPPLAPSGTALIRKATPMHPWHDVYVAQGFSARPLNPLGILNICNWVGLGAGNRIPTPYTFD